MFGLFTMLEGEPKKKTIVRTVLKKNKVRPGSTDHSSSAQPAENLTPEQPTAPATGNVPGTEAAGTQTSLEPGDKRDSACEQSEQMMTTPAGKETKIENDDDRL